MRRAAGITIGAVAVLMLGLSAMEYWALGRMSNAFAPREQSLAVGSILSNLSVSLRAAEVRQHTSLRTGDPELHRLLEATLDDADRDLDRILILLAEEPGQRPRLLRLRQLVHARAAELLAAAPGQSGGTGSAPALAALISEIEIEQSRFNAESLRRRRSESAGARATVVLGSLLGAVLLSGAAWVAFREGTRRLAAQRQLEKAVAVADAASAGRIALLARMNHELRTPLNSILGFTEILVDRRFGELNERQERYLDYILSSGRSLLRLVDEMQDLTHLPTSGPAAAAEACSLAPALDDALAIVGGKAALKGIRIQARVDGLPALRVEAGKLRQIFYQLLSNAVKFTPEGGTVTVSATLAEGSGQLRVAVADTGIGIRPEDHERVFRELEKLPSGEAAGAGYGLGLPLCRRLVELQGGRIWLESDGAGRGSTFLFTLPLAGLEGTA